MAQTKINGKFGILYKWDPSVDTTGAYVVIGCATSNGFSSSRSVNESDVNKCDPDTITKEYGGLTQSIDFEGHIVTDADKQTYFDMLDDQEAGIKPDFKYDFDTSNPGTYVRYFKGLITDLSPSQEVNTDSTWSMTVEVDGKSVKTDPLV